MKKLLIVFIFSGLLFASPAYADLFGFNNISNNSGVAEDLAGQFYLEVIENSGEVLFNFYNGGAVPGIGDIMGTRAAFINEIYFDYDPGSLALNSPELNFNNYLSNDYVYYKTLGGADPDHLPGGNTVGFASVWSTEPWTEGENQEGIDVNDKLGILWDGDFAAVIAAIMSEDLRIGLHVKGIDTVLGDSDSFINTNLNSVAEPATMLLLGIGLVGLAVFGRQRFFKK